MAVDNELRTRFFRVLDLNLRFSGDEGDGKYLKQDKYVPGLHQQAGSDPMGALRDYIELSATEGAYLFSGMKGTGKTTELLRLQYELNQGGEFAVFYSDVRDHFNMLECVEIGDFMLTLCAVVAEEISADDRLGKDFADRSYWDRFVDTLFSEVELKELSAEADWKMQGGPGAKVAAKLSLRDNITFKKRVQDKLRVKSEQLTRSAQIFLADTAHYVKEKLGVKRVLWIVDSLEHLRGPTQKESLDIFESVATLFSSHHATLRWSGASVIYSIPPYLSAISQGFAAYYAGGRVFPLANVHIFDRVLGECRPNAHGIGLMRQVVGKRFPEWRSFFNEAGLDRLALSSGGDLRDFFRLVQSCLTSARPEKMQVPFSDEVLTGAEGALREDFRFLSNDDFAWLSRVARSHWHEMPTFKDLPRLAMLLDGKSMLNYRNGDDWYDVHPLLKERVKALPPANEAAPA